YFNTDTIRNNVDLPENIVDIGGNVTAALILGQSSKGICLESQTNFTDSDWSQLAVMFKELTNPKKSLIKIMCENNLQDALPFKDIPKNILKILNKLSADKKAAALLDVVCGKRHQFKNKYGVGNRSIEKYSDDKLIDKLDELLNKKQPASASYDLDFIRSDEFYRRDMSEGYTAHVSTIIGRRFNESTNKCEYLIKDSVGNRCPKNTIYDCEKSTGLMWVPRENLQKNLYEVNWLVKAPTPK
ncbi:MAG: hypothetical protein K2Q18_00695, partial [Bdellovibrionales bacterium]|nr:hypothetical protein [Bdellovibrionales bacterium]